MAAVVRFTGAASWKSFCHKPNAKPSLATKTTSHFEKNSLETHHQNVNPRKQNIKIKTHRYYPILASKMGIIFSSSSLSPSETIKELYACINDGKLKRLGDYISADCYIEECSFPTPFVGREEVLNFLDQFITGMGDNVKFRVKQVCEGDELIAAANWHLEWKKAEIPYTRGCSFYECSKEGAKLVIKKAQVVIESPIKPGGLVLDLLKIVTKVFDHFPKTSEWFLKSPHITLQRLVKIYTILFGILINPILKSYLHVDGSSTWFCFQNFGVHSKEFHQLKVSLFTFQSSTSSERGFHLSVVFPSRLKQDSSKERAIGGPRNGGSGGGQLKATIGSAFSFVAAFSSKETSFPCFFDVVEATLPIKNITLLFTAL